MAEIELICLLLMLVAGLDVAARRVGLPYPVLLVITGLALSMVPRLPDIGFNPEFVLLAFLPPLLYPAALFTSWRDFRRSLRPILLLAIGLVLATTGAVAAVAHAIIPGLPWEAAIVLGAIVSPPDAISATAVLQRMSIPRRVVTILEGESLVNDALALVIYRFGVAAVVWGRFPLGQAALSLPLVTLGGMAIGLAVAWTVHWLQRHLDDPPVQITISLLTPFVCYLPAEQVHCSGVLAVVTCGIFLGWRSPLMVTARTRLEAAAFWRMMAFLLNGIIFLLIGLQLPRILHGFTGESWVALLRQTLAIALTAVLVRIAWVFPGAYLPHLLSAKVRARERRPAVREVAIIGWSGMRGVVSLAAALALPMATSTGAEFPGRDAIILVSFGVILFTLVFQGLTLPLLIRALRVKDDGEAQHEERLALRLANEAALAYVESLGPEEEQAGTRIELLRTQYQERLEQLADLEELPAEPGPEELPVAQFRRIERKALQIERQRVIELRNSHQINDETLRIVQRDLDLADSRLAESIY